jgi:nitroimidazol reductase NimA-like FMN-containing flavoprotein (pyridoxamine 5'-phosphate oxidase superfamily)
MTTTPDGIEVLELNDCWSLLRSAQVGRLAVTTAHGPDVFPVNFVVDHGTVVFRTDPGSKLTNAVVGGPVAFEADGLDADSGAAWSVVLKGTAERVRDVREILDALQLPLSPWHGAPKHFFVRVVPQHVSGRRFRVADRAVWDLPGSVTRAASE